jgi:hypothetical protein
MQNLYDKNQMVEIELEIRGDPWWIGMSNLEQNEYSYKLGTTTGTAVNVTQADFLRGENFLLLSFKTGSNYDESTGFMKFNTSSSYFNGFYAVLEVDNNFENGRFTQTLKAYKEPFSQKIGKTMSAKTTIAPTAPTAATPAAKVTIPAIPSGPPGIPGVYSPESGMSFGVGGLSG